MPEAAFQVRNSEFHLTPDELSKLIGGAQSQRDRLMVLILAFTGIRRAELRSLRPADIDSRSERLIVRRGKGGKQRIVFLPKWVAEDVRHFASQSAAEFVFPGRKGGPMSLRNINYILTRVGRLAGIPTPNPRYVGIGPHLLRHSFARNWKRSGGSIESLQKMLGHASVKTTLDCYGTEDLREVEANYRERCARLVAS
jgi:integrase/recombinase XerD